MLTQSRLILLILNFLLIGNSTARAQLSERYPSEREMQQLRPQLSGRVREILSSDTRYYLDDSRSEQEKQGRQAFVNAWKKVNLSVAPFLGQWEGYEQSLAIYPSIHPDRVCILEFNEEGFAGLTTGNVLANGEIRTSGRRFIVRHEDYLGVAGVYNGRPFMGGDIPLHSPGLLSIPSSSTLTSLNETSEFNNTVRRTIRQFNEAGCTASLPNIEARQEIQQSDDETQILKLIREPILNNWQSIQSYVVDRVVIIDNYAVVAYGVGQNGGTVTLRKRRDRWQVLQTNFSLTIGDLVEVGVPRRTAALLVQKLDSREEKQQELEQFRQAWSRENPTVARFLGYWRASTLDDNTTSVSIWPSRITNRVCIVRFSGLNSQVEIGEARGNRASTASTSFVYSDDPNFGPFLNSDAYAEIGFPSALNTWYFSSQTLQELEEAQCSDRLPR